MTGKPMIKVTYRDWKWQEEESSMYVRNNVKQERSIGLVFTFVVSPTWNLEIRNKLLCINGLSVENGFQMKKLGSTALISLAFSATARPYPPLPPFSSITRRNKQKMTHLDDRLNNSKCFQQHIILSDTFFLSRCNI